MDWELYKQPFEWDGSYRDIYIFDTELADWQKLLDWLKASSYMIQLWKSDEGQKRLIPLPDRADTFFAEPNSIPYTMAIDVGGCVLTCHFIYESPIEFFLVPSEITEEKILARVFDFMTGLGLLFHRDVVLTAENRPEWVIFRFDFESKTIKLEFDDQPT